jgi:DNA repair exonuclease SbcCD nuclease subunit
MDSVKVLVIGDPHLRQKWIKVVDEFTRQTIELVDNPNTRPDIVVILGDTLHDHEQTRESCHTRAINWFKELAQRVYTIVLIGNHDRPSNSHYLTGSHFFNGLEGIKNLKIVDRAALSTEVTKGNHTYRFVSVPYVPNGRFEDALGTLKTDIKSSRPTAIFAHQEFKGCKMGAIVSTDGDVWPTDAPLVISGHVHEHQIPQDNMIYVGTPYQTSYSEDANKAVYTFVFDGKKDPEIKRIRLKLRVKQSLTISPKELADFKLPDATTDFRLVIKGPQEEVEACKQTRVYKEAAALPHIKIVLRPILDVRSIVGKEEKPIPYIRRLYDSVKNDPEIFDMYVKVLGKVQ